MKPPGRRQLSQYRSPSRFLADEGGWLSLVALLLTIVIILILAVYLLGGSSPFQRNQRNAAGLVGSEAPLGAAGGAIAARNRAKDVECRNNLQQLRMALQMSQGEEGGAPPSLEELARQNPGLKLECPVGGEPYEYDTATGRIRCVHPGHEAF